MKNNMSPKMKECFSKLQEHGHLIREHGGFWTCKNAPRKIWCGKEDDAPEWYFNLSTVEALVKRGYAEIVETRKWHNREYIIEIRPTQTMTNQEHDEHYELFKTCVHTHLPNWKSMECDEFMELFENLTAVCYDENLDQHQAAKVIAASWLSQEKVLRNLKALKRSMEAAMNSGTGIYEP